MHVEITVNGESRSDDVEPRLLLAHYLRDVCGLRATNIGCDTTSCGACTVHVDGEAVKSCTVLAVSTADVPRSPRWKAWRPGPSQLHPVQQAFRAEHALQCGFCTPGHGDGGGSADRRARPELTEADVREGLEGNLCRCTGYHNIVRAVLAAARERQGATA